MAQTKAESDSSAVTFLDLRIFMEHFDQQNQTGEFELEPHLTCRFLADLNLKSMELARGGNRLLVNMLINDRID